MAGDRLVLVKKLVPWCELYPVEAGEGEPRPGEVWVEREGKRQWLVRVVALPAGQGKPHGVLLRRATETDLAAHRAGVKIAADRMGQAQEEARKLGLRMRFIACEQSLRGRFVRLYFTAQGRVDFRELVRILSQAFQAKVELRQVGARDAAKLVGGLGVCGRPLCCRTFLREFKSISVKMATEQSLTQAPQRLTGVCGRLRCCLSFEHPQYRELLEGLPRIGKKVAGLDARVIGYNIFRGVAILERKDGERFEVPLGELNGS